MKKMRNKFLAATLAVSMVIGASVPVMAEENGGELVVWTFLNPADEKGRGKVLANLIDAYEEEYPEYTVKVESLQWDTLSAKFLAAHQTNTAPDIIFLNTSNFAEGMAVGALEPFEDLFLNEWTEEELADINDARFQMGVTDDKHYQALLFANTMGIIYRKDMLEANNIEPNFQTWDDVIAAAEALTFVDDDGNQVYGLGTGYSEASADCSMLLDYCFNVYGSVVDEQGQPVWTNPDAVEILEKQIALIDNGYMPASAMTLTSDDVYTDFMAGKYAMILGGTVRIPTIQSQCVFDPEDVAIAAFPSEGASNISLVGGWNVGVWSGSEHKEAAGRFIEMMISPEFDEQWVTEGGQIPLRKSTVEKLSDVFNEPLNTYINDAMVLLANAATDNTTFVTSGYKMDINRAMQYAYSEEYSPEEAAAETAADFLEATGN